MDNRRLPRVRLLLKYSRKHWRRYVFIALAGLTLPFPDLLVAYLIRDMVNNDRTADLMSWLPILGASIALFMGKGLLAYFYNRNALSVAFDITASVQKSVVSTITRLDLGSYLRQEPGDLLVRISDSARQVEQILVSLIRIFLCEGILIIAYIVAIIVISPVIFLGLLALVVPYTVVLHFQHRTVVAYAEAAILQRAHWMSRLEEFLSLFEFFRATHTHRLEREAFDKVTDATAATEKRLEIRKALVGPFLEILLGLGVIIVVMLAIHELTTGSLQGGDIIAAFGLVLLIIRPSNRLVVSAGNIRHRIAHLDRILEVFDMESRTAGSEPAEDMLTYEEGPICLEVESLSYSPEPETPVLSDVHLSWQGPGLIAITGRSGVGKTTLARIICGMMPPHAGRIRIFHQGDMEHSIAYLPQNLRLPNRSLRDIISSPDPEPSAEKVDHLADRLNLTHLLGTKETALRQSGSAGSALSEGERRRLGLANLLYNDFEILVLDEPLSGVHEAQASQLVDLLLQRSLRDKLIVVVTHRELLLRQAARVFFLDDATIVNSGRHEDLLSEDSRYCAVCQAHTHGDGVGTK